MLEELTMVLVTTLNVAIKIDPAMKQIREYTQMNHTLDPYVSGVDPSESDARKERM
ncbi:hypothetical protein YC2023_066820 [Brassica napus]